MFLTSRFGSLVQFQHVVTGKCLACRGTIYNTPAKIARECLCLYVHDGNTTAHLQMLPKVRSIESSVLSHDIAGLSCAHVHSLECFCRVLRLGMCCLCVCLIITEPRRIVKNHINNQLFM